MVRLASGTRRPAGGPADLPRNSSAKQRAWICCCFIAPWIFLAALLQSSILARRPAASAHLRSLQQQQQNQVFLAALIFNRVFKADKFNITSHECRQWIDYMLAAGVDRIYWYDTAHDESESQEAELGPYIRSGAVRYHRFYSLFPPLDGADFHYEQDNSYAHFLSAYNSSARWTVEMDVDEYPFSPADLQPGFLARFLGRIEADVSQVLLQCMLFMGNPIGEGWVIERYQRRKGQTEGKVPGFHSRQKPVFMSGRAAGVTGFDPHKFPMSGGRTVVADAAEMRMNHYWGPRGTDFGPDTPQVIQSLVDDRSIQAIADRLKNGGGGGRRNLLRNRRHREEIEISQTGDRIQ